MVFNLDILQLEAYWDSDVTELILKCLVHKICYGRHFYLFL